MKLSEIPNPPFTIGPDCKFILNKYIILIFIAKTFIICFIPSSFCFIGFSILHIIFVRIWIFKVISILLNLLSLITGWLTFILNPGIVYNDNTINDNEPKIYCYQCRFLYPHLKQPIAHCEKCGVCCFGRDHHCDVFGKCVAKDNLKIFISFFICTCLLFVANFVSIALMIS